MPGLDYTKVANGPAPGVFAKPLNGEGRFYDGRPGRELVTCPDCQLPADASLGGDHGGDCVPYSVTPVPSSALGVLRVAAKRLLRFSANDVRADFENAGVKGTSRGPAFAEATRRGWIKPDGSVRSLDRATKGHPVQTYESLIHPEAVKRAKATRAKTAASGRR